MKDGGGFRSGIERRSFARARSVVPALRKVREERGTHRVGNGEEVKRVGHPAGVTYVLSGMGLTGPTN